MLLKGLETMGKIVWTLLLILSVFPLCVASQWRHAEPGLLGVQLEVTPSSLYDGGAITYKDGMLWAGRKELYSSKDSGKSWLHVPTPSTSFPDDYDRFTNIIFYDKKKETLKAITIIWNKKSIRGYLGKQ